MSVESVKRRLEAVNPDIDHDAWYVDRYSIYGSETLHDFDVASIDWTPQALDFAQHTPTDLALALDVVEAAKKDHWPRTETVVNQDGDDIDGCPCGLSYNSCGILVALEALEEALEHPHHLRERPDEGSALDV